MENSFPKDKITSIVAKEDDNTMIVEQTIPNTINEEDDIKNLKFVSNQPIKTERKVLNQQCNNPISRFMTKGENGDVRFEIPLEYYKQDPFNYYINLRPLLFKPDSDNESSLEDDVQEADEDNATQSGKNIIEPEDQVKPKKKPSKKKTKGNKKRKPSAPDADYDYDDPFIDDTEAVEGGGVNVSIFDLMSGRVDMDALSEDSTVSEENNDDDTDGSEKKEAVVRMRFAKTPAERAKDFFVYQGPLLSGGKVVESDFEKPRPRKKSKLAKKVAVLKAKLPKVKSPTKKQEKKTADEPKKPKSPLTKRPTTSESKETKKAKKEKIETKSTTTVLLEGLFNDEGGEKSKENASSSPFQSSQKTPSQQQSANPSATPKRQQYDVEKVTHLNFLAIHSFSCFFLLCIDHFG